ncbi:hypothetical protein A0J48_011165 [Sphaerospermopsis aphanizomenoides BCCUSP55]|uniref:hypothetical protein n=1 Tax=Sphaerospermopsis aphanizomenoides TaxID=459663 RepID=UPI0019089345|nr:hypothetical protein [Sphaerospermopsis aphanizomenoides]MBK1988091.1 hypothetical protein [Sphaerospermopsis aphanizomenoides BCCUSP55]
MSENYPYNQHQLFRDLSPEEQESLTGGKSMNLLKAINFFLQKTDIDTEADSNLNIGVGEDTGEHTKYKLSQLTIGYSILFATPNSHQTMNE